MCIKFANFLPPLMQSFRQEVGDIRCVWYFLFLPECIHDTQNMAVA